MPVEILQPRRAIDCKRPGPWAGRCVIGREQERNQVQGVVGMVMGVEDMVDTSPVQSGPGGTPKSTGATVEQQYFRGSRRISRVARRTALPLRNQCPAAQDCQTHCLLLIQYYFRNRFSTVAVIAVTPVLIVASGTG